MNTEQATPRSTGSEASAEGWILVGDLMFASQVQGLARSAAVKLIWVRTVSDALTRAETQTPVCVILDVNLVGDQIEELTGRLKALGRPPVLIGFGAHVDAAALARARQAGCKVVLPRSKFVQEIGQSLSDWLSA